MRIARVSAALSTLVLAAGAHAAAAATFCVAKPSCVTAGGTPAPDLGAALNATAANGGGRDRIELGSGTIPYAGAATDAAGNPVDIVGAGRKDTTLQTTGTLLTMQEPTSTFTDARIVATGSPSAVTDLAAGTFRRVDIDATGTDPAATVTGISLHGGGALVDDAGVTMATGQTNYAVRYDSGPGETAPVVSKLVATAAFGVYLTGPGALGIVASDLRGRTAGVRATGGTATIDDSVVRAGGAVGLSADVASAATTPASIVARQVTVLLSSAATGLEASSATAGQDATVSATDTVIHGPGLAPGTAASASATGGASATVSLDYSAYVLTAVSAGGAGAAVNGGTAHHDLDLTSTAPGFLDEANGDIRLLWSSPLVDAGDPTLTAGPGTDIAGVPRLRDGNGDGTPVRDIGAIEYQHVAPTITTAATPTTAGTDQEIAFSALVLDGDAGEVPAVTWSFDDGTTATGTTTSHAFATGGDHTATATARDPSGLTTSSTVTVHVLADNPPPKIDTTGPRIFVRLLRGRLDRRRIFLVGVFCPADERPRCTGTVTVRRGGARIALATLRASAGGTQIVRLRVSRATAALAHRRRVLGVVATIVATDLLGNPTTKTLRVKLRPLR